MKFKYIVFIIILIFVSSFILSGKSRYNAYSNNSNGYPTKYSNRYPISVEYKIINSCMHAHGKSYSVLTDIYLKKCTRALRKTQSNISYYRYLNNKKLFFYYFNQNLR